MRFIFITAGSLLAFTKEAVSTTSGKGIPDDVTLQRIADEYFDSLWREEEADRIYAHFNDKDRPLSKRKLLLKQERESLLRLGAARVREQVQKICPEKLAFIKDRVPEKLFGFPFEQMTAEERVTFCQEIDNRDTENFYKLKSEVTERVIFEGIVKNANKSKGQQCVAQTLIQDFLEGLSDYNRVMTSIMLFNFTDEERWILCELLTKRKTDIYLYEKVDGLSHLQTRYFERVHNDVNAQFVQSVIYLCGISAIDLFDIHPIPDDISLEKIYWSKIDSLENLAWRGLSEAEKILPPVQFSLLLRSSTQTDMETVKKLHELIGFGLSEDEKQTLCGLARERDFDIERLHRLRENIDSRYVHVINARLEKNCRDVGESRPLMPLVGYRRHFNAMKTKSQLAEMCSLYADFTAWERFGRAFSSRTEYGSLFNALMDEAEFVNKYAPRLSQLCEFTKLKLRNAVDLVKSEDFLNQHGSDPDNQRRIGQICHAAVPHGNLFVLLKTELQRLTEMENTEVANFERKCKDGVSMRKLFKSTMSSLEAIREMGTDEQIDELCQLLSEPVEGSVKIQTFLDEVKKVNTYAPELSRICSFSALRDRDQFQLENASNIMQTLSYSEKKSLGDVCEAETDIVEAIKEKFGLKDEDLMRKMTRATNLSSICGETVPYTRWGTIEDVLLSKFDEVAGMDLSKINKQRVCEILSSYLIERAGEFTESEAEVKALDELESIVGQNGPVSRAIHKAGKGFLNQIRKLYPNEQ